MSKNRKMANFGLYLVLIGAILAAIGGFVYNKYSGKSRTENHEELLDKQNELADKIDSNKKEIIDNITKKPNKTLDKALSDEENKKTDNSLNKNEKQSRNQIINNAPNQGVQINENNGTVIIPESALKPLPRHFAIDEAKQILKNYPLDFPIEIWMKGANDESQALFDQVNSVVQNLGYKNVSTNLVGMYISVGQTITKDFEYKIENGKLVFSIYPQKK